MGRKIKVDGGLDGADLRRVAQQIEQLEAIGYDGAVTAETAHDPFLPLAQAALCSRNIELATGIAVAFARTPMTLAPIAHDLNAASEGRFILGLGSQIRAHITKRFGMPWSKPAARMREFILALRAIWRCWYEEEPLDFRGEFYQHTLMTPFFAPKNIRYGAPKVFLAAVGPLMTEVAGEVADGINCHAFTTESYMRDTTLPAIKRGLERAGRRLDDFEIAYSAFIVTGDSEQNFEQNLTLAKRQIAFYGSTPAYRAVLESVGVGDLQPKLNTMSKAGQWKAMGALISDEILHEFAIVREPKDVPLRLKEKFGDLVNRVSVPYADLSPEICTHIVAGIHGDA